jgi:hypothetical protein
MKAIKKGVLKTGHRSLLLLFPTESTWYKGQSILHRLSLHRMRLDTETTLVPTRRPIQVQAGAVKPGN